LRKKASSRSEKVSQVLLINGCARWQVFLQAFVKALELREGEMSGETSSPRRMNKHGRDARVPDGNNHLSTLARSTVPHTKYHFLSTLQNELKFYEACIIDKLALKYIFF
jgi:hypothetical protein